MIVTLGYEGRSAEEVVDLVRDCAVLVDVRYNALSHKPGLSKTRLGAALQEAGVEYVHERSLGVPPPDREAFRAGEREAYRERLRTAAAEALARVTDLARTQRVALLCAEREPDRCHRSVLAEAIGGTVEHR